MKKTYTPKQKASIALMAVKGESVSKLAGQYQIHPTQIGQWKKTVEDGLDALFVDKRKKENYGKDRIIEELYKNIGRREVEISWLKKKFNLELPREISLD